MQATLSICRIYLFSEDGKDDILAAGFCPGGHRVAASSLVPTAVYGTYARQHNTTSPVCAALTCLHHGSRSYTLAAFLS